jgi:transcriptional regulator with XRE-family HTH domain
MELANRIRKIRETHGLTQADVAYKANITPQAYGKIERKASKTKLETLIKISEILEVSLIFLLDTQNPNYKEKNNL